jgi:hypothetical protein
VEPSEKWPNAGGVRSYGSLFEVLQKQGFSVWLTGGIVAYNNPGATLRSVLARAAVPFTHAR